MRKLSRILLSASAVVASAPAHSAWYQASSKHFVIYADSNAKQLQAFASQLERFDQAVRTVMRYDDPPVGDGNRLTVFVLPTVAAVQNMAGKQAGNILGFYQPRAEGCIAFVPRTTGNASSEIDANSVFFHEYTHHLQFENLTKPNPEWLVEGFAEFMQTASFQKDGSVVLGAAPEERAWALLASDQIPLTSLFVEGYGKLNDEQQDVFYGEGWLLTHYLFMNSGRSAQLVQYLNLLDSGVPRSNAAQQAFGDLTKLQHELTVYKNERSLLGMKIGADRTQPGPIDVEPLSQGAAAVILLRADLKMHGQDKASAQRLAGQIRAVESQHVGDELVEATLAEADLDDGDTANAEAAADRALKANAKNVEALIYKGRAIEERAKAAAGPDRHNFFEHARDLLIAANKIDTEDPEPLYDYYKSFLVEGVRPPDDAIAAMHYASDLVPQDMGLRINSAIAYLNEAKAKEAREALTVVAYSPHATGGAGDVARHMISAIDGGDLKAALLAVRTASGQTSSGH